MKDVFPLITTSNYDIRNRKTFYSRTVKIVYNGTESLSYLAPKIWELIPKEIRLIESLSVFKIAIRKWIPINCPCRLCRIYVPQLGFIQGVF